MAEDMQEQESGLYFTQETEDEMRRTLPTNRTSPDFPELRNAVRMYACIQYAAALILKAGGGSASVLAVRNTRERMADGRPALEVVTDQAEGAYFKIRASTLIPIDTVNSLVSRMMSGDMPFMTENKAIERF